MNTLGTIETSLGEINFELFDELTPKTVSNFIGLAKGTKLWRHPADKRPMTTPLYDGVLFHRVIDGFMIQTGDPLGTGTGGPGYVFEDECRSDLPHQPFVLSMANRGKDTNGSQFFITLVETPWLNGKHTVFGRVTDEQSQEVVKKIGKSKTRDSRPVRDLRIIKIRFN